MKQSNNKPPLVSVIITAYNTEQFISDALKSIVNQTYKNLEIIVVDDGSTDKTWKIIRQFNKTDSRIKAYRLKNNNGPSYVSNYAVRKAKGKYVARLDADDIAYYNRIAKQVDYLESHPEIVMLGGQSKIIDEQGKIIGEKRFPLTHEKIYDSMFMMNPIQHPGCMFRLKTFKRAGISYEKQYFISHDLKILFELLKYGKFANLPDIILKYRFRPDSITHKNPKRTFNETIAIRHMAWKKGIYTPTLYGIVIHFLQVLLVKLLPNQTINNLFRLWRIKKIVSVKPIIEEGLQNAYRFTIQTLLTLFYFLYINNKNK